MTDINYHVYTGWICWKFHGIGGPSDLSKGVFKRGIYLKLENSMLCILYIVCAGADPELTLGCCKILQKKLKIEMI